MSPTSDSSSTAVPSSLSSSRTSNSSPLMSTLSRLSLSTSRPSVPSEAPEGYTTRTLRFVGRSGKEALRRSGLAGLWSPEAQAGRSSDSIEAATLGEPFSSHQVGRENDRPKGPVLPQEHSSPGSMRSIRTLIDITPILYPTLTQHPAPVPYPILALSLSRAGEAAGLIRHDKLFELLLSRLEPWVGEEGEGGYVLIVLAADGGRGGLPGARWWAWRWRRIPRKYRKNLKRLYIVHPSVFTRTLLPFLLPFLSPKVYTKLHPFQSLLNFYHTRHVSLAGLEPTLEVLAEEARVLRERPEIHPIKSSKWSEWQRTRSDNERGTWAGTIREAVGAAGSYLPVPRWGSWEGIGGAERAGPRGANGYWSRSAEALVIEAGGKVPRLLVDLRKVILSGCTTTEGMFRRTSNSHLLPAIIALLDIPCQDQPSLPWSDIARDDPLLPPKVLLRFVSELSAPMIPHNLYDTLRQSRDLASLRNRLMPLLPPANQLILSYIIHLLHHVSQHESSTRMSPLALAIIFAPCLISGPDPLEDGEMCLEPGKVLPSALRIAARSGGGRAVPETGNEGENREMRRGNTLVGVLEIWIREYPAVRGEGEAGGTPCLCAWAQGGEAAALDGGFVFGGAPYDMATTTDWKATRRASMRHELLGKVGAVGGTTSPSQARRGIGKEGTGDVVDQL